MTNDEMLDIIDKLERMHQKVDTVELADLISDSISEIEKLRKERDNYRNTTEMLMRCDFVGCENQATGGTPQKNGLYYMTCKEHHHLAECGF